MKKRTANPQGDLREAEKYFAALETIQEHKLQEFLDWLASGPKVGNANLQLCLIEAGDRIVVDEYAIEHYGDIIFANYFNIDLDAVDRHRKALLDRQRRAPPVLFLRRAEINDPSKPDWYLLDGGDRDRACIEGSPEQWRSVAAVMRSGGSVHHDRVACRPVGEHAWELWSPRNAHAARDTVRIEGSIWPRHIEDVLDAYVSNDNIDDAPRYPPGCPECGCTDVDNLGDGVSLYCSRCNHAWEPVAPEPVAPEEDPA